MSAERVYFLLQAEVAVPTTNPGAWNEALLVDGRIAVAELSIKVRWFRQFVISTPDNKTSVRYVSDAITHALESDSALDRVRTAMIEGQGEGMLELTDGVFCGPLINTRWTVKDRLDLVSLEDGETRLIWATRTLCDGIPTRVEQFSLDGIFGTVAVMMADEIMNRYGTLDIERVEKATMSQFGDRKTIARLRDGGYVVIDLDPDARL